MILTSVTRSSGVGKFVVDFESRDNLRACGSDGTTVACSSGGATKELMSNESCFFDFLTATRNSNGNLKPSRSVHINTNVASWERLAIAKSSTSSGLWCQVGGERHHRQDLESLTSCRDPMLRCKGAVSFAPDGSQSTRDPMTLLNSVVVAVTSTITFQRPDWRWSKL